jgi:hypothetical protein
MMIDLWIPSSSLFLLLSPPPPLEEHAALLFRILFRRGSSLKDCAIGNIYYLTKELNIILVYNLSFKNRFFQVSWEPSAVARSSLVLLRRRRRQPPTATTATAAPSSGRAARSYCLWNTTWRRPLSRWLLWLKSDLEEWHNLSFYQALRFLKTWASHTSALPRDTGTGPRDPVSRVWRMNHFPYPNFRSDQVLYPVHLFSNDSSSAIQHGIRHIPTWSN